MYLTCDILLLIVEEGGGWLNEFNTAGTAVVERQDNIKFLD